MPREQAGAVMMPLQSHGSECIMVFGGIAPTEGGGRRVPVSVVDTYNVLAGRWLPQQRQLLNCSPELASRRSHRVTQVNSNSMLVLGGRPAEGTLCNSNHSDGHDRDNSYRDMLGLLNNQSSFAHAAACPGVVSTRSACVSSLSPRRCDVSGSSEMVIKGHHFEDTGMPKLG